MSESSVPDNEDSAWVSIDTPFNTKELRAFLDDIERLYRINSMLVFDSWQLINDKEFSFKLKNLSNGRLLESALSIDSSDDGIKVSYQQGLRTSTSFHVEPKDDGNSRLIVTDDYSGTPASEREQRIDEVDKSLVNWGNDLHGYLHRWKRWSWVPGWPWYMRKIWQPMKPMARRITYILYVVTVAEMILFLLVFTVFRLELSKYLY
ncbi:MAG: hypothetical protein CL388_02065 [Acidiferrobacteraceae bacterium]|jgi:hypothetical protein|nr:hypothetical protein [Acidiferrobacteraceae bacterium]MDP6434610.1 hypothetical protein [Arenicellales bacterium]MDP6672765.1 hypothetical protein [Arenicellales bacterium]MDP6724221.1 hypothetical protein [Arenicellales bacterium]MEE1539661.1 hypothetical protein [Arenicellales bacterium]|tara:strand:+ start:2737 stop:3354 length:618 start_codon:yes stop_codon:yes gene_type:complete